jgi:hypothetical protein
MLPEPNLPPKENNLAISHPCPFCGYCPTCGRGSSFPVYIPPTPNSWPITITASGDTTKVTALGGNINVAF